LGNRAAHLINWANAQRDWPNARAFGQSCSAFDQLGKRTARFTKRCAIGQLPRV